MNGAAMVLPRDGRKDRDGKTLPWDKIASVREQDFYLPAEDDDTCKTDRNAGGDSAGPSKEMRTLTPTHVVFNGSVNVLTDNRAVPADVGMRMLMIHNRCNRDGRPRLQVGHGDDVWKSSFGDPPMAAMETWFVRGDRAVAASHTFRQPGVCTDIDHNTIEGALPGAAAYSVIWVEWDNALMEQVVAPRVKQVRRDGPVMKRAVGIDWLGPDVSVATGPAAGFVCRVGI